MHSITKPKPIIIVQGAQWGSEAKGVIASFLCRKHKVSYAVRTGAVNAGHTVILDGQVYKMQQLPTGWTNPQTKLVVGAGAFIQPEILAREIEMINRATGEDVRTRLLIDHRASLHLTQHQTEAQRSGDHYRFGATGKGASKAIIDKLQNRGKGYKLFREWYNEQSREKSHELWQLGGIQFADTTDILHGAYDAGERILLEGTQGSLLDLHLGPYPYTTHKQTQAAQWVVEAGLSPNMEFEVVLIARTFPIRVAGNSGPMSKETTWSNLARDLNRKLMLQHLPQRVRSFALEEFEKVWIEVARSGKFKMPQWADGSPNYDLHKWSAKDREEYGIAMSELPATVMQGVTLRTKEELANLFEFTTVTNKLRRIAEWSSEDVRWACKINRASYLVVTFWNYLFPELWGNKQIVWDGPQLRRLGQIEAEVGVPVRYVNVGPEDNNVIEVPTVR